MNPIGPEGRNSFRHHSVLPRFRDAFRGLLTAYRKEPNLRFHTFAAACALVAGMAVRLEGWEVAYLSFTILLVLFAEVVNTAVERVVDLASGGYLHPLAATAKEVAAGAVLLTAIHAAAAGIYLFAYRRNLLESVAAIWGLLVESPWLALLPLAAALLGVLGGRDHRKL